MAKTLAEVLDEKGIHKGDCVNRFFIVDGQVTMWVTRCYLEGPVWKYMLSKEVKKCSSLSDADDYIELKEEEK